MRNAGVLLSLRCLSCLLTLAGCRSADPTALAAITFPDTPAARQFQAFLVLFNSGDGPAYMAFLDEHYPTRASSLRRQMEPRLRALPFRFRRGGLREQTGGFDVRRIEQSTPTGLVGLLQERETGQFVRFTASVDAAPPYRIQSVDFKPADRPLEFSRAMRESDLLPALREKLATDAAADRFAGSVLLAKRGAILFSGAYGLADREKNVPNTVDSRFRIASLTKMFTAVAILQLVDNGKLDLSQPIVRYLPDYPNAWVANRVTLHQLLTHTSGIHDFIGPEYRANLANLRTLQDYVRLFAANRLDFRPGSRFQYSNYGFVVLGLIVERVSGQTYYDYVRDHIYGPAGMTASGSQAEGEPVPGRVVGYTTARLVWQPPRIGPEVAVGDALHSTAENLPYRGTSAGFGYSTVLDLERFVEALVDHRLLSPESTDLVTSAKVDDPGKGGQYGYGFEIETLNGERCFGHSGAYQGMNGVLRMCPASGYLVVVLSNLDPPGAVRIADFIGARLPPLTH